MSNKTREQADDWWTRLYFYKIYSVDVVHESI